MESILSTIHQLISPTPGLIGTESISCRLHRIQDKLPSSEIEIWTNFIDVAHDLLDRLREELNSKPQTIVPSSSDPSKLVALNHLDLEQTSWVIVLIELLCCWAIIPNLSCSVPISSRGAQFSEIYSFLPSSYTNHLENHPHIRKKCLKLLHLCLYSKELFPITINQFLSDLIAGFAKFAFDPFSQANDETEWFKSEYKKLILNQAIPAPNLARSLLLMLSFGQENKFVQVYSTSLTMLICERPNGVFAIMSALLDTKNNMSTDEMILKTAKSISTMPQNAKPEIYFKKVCPQLLIIIRGNKGENTEKYLKTACEVYREWSIQYPELTKQHLLIPAASPLLPFLVLIHQNNTSNRFLYLDKIIKRIENEQNQLIEDQLTTKQKKLIVEIDENYEAPIQPTQSQKRNQIGNLENEESLLLGKDNILSSYRLDSTDDFWLQSFLMFKSQISETETQVITPADILSSCISNLSLLCIYCGNSSFMANFSPIIPALFEILKSVSENDKKNAFLKKDAQFIIERYFKVVENDLAVNILIYIALYNDKDWQKLGLFGGKRRNFSFELQNDRLQLESSIITEENQEIVRNVKSEAFALVDILKIIDKEDRQGQKITSTTDLVGNFFLSLLETLFLIINQIKAKTSSSGSYKSISPEEVLNFLVLASEKQMILIEVILALIEQMGPSVLRNPIQICLFIKNMIQNDDQDIVYLSLVILDQVIKLKLVSRIESDILLFDLLTPLKILAEQSETREDIQKLSNDLYDQIISYSKTILEENQDEKSGSNGDENQPDLSASNSKNKRRFVLDPHASNVEEALKMISSPLVPIRAGGLIQLRRFLLQEDKNTVSRLPEIIQIFIQNLSNDDSYVYLGAIQGLSAVADVNFVLAMPHLKQQYLNTKKSVEIRLNVGEAILQVARRLGTVLPKYSKEIFEVLIFAAQKDEQTLIRASSISLLGEVCELLRFGILPYIEEIMAMVYDIIQIEKDNHVKRAAINLVKQLFKGLSKDILSVIPHHIQRLVSLFESIEISDNDHILREHAKIALDLYHSGIEDYVKQAVSQQSANIVQLIDPQGFYSSLKII